MIARIQFLLLWPVCLFAALLSLLWLPVALLIGSPRGRRMLVAFDRLGNALTGGDDRETISSRANRGTNEGSKGWCLLCKLLDLVQKDHCRISAGK